MKKFRIENRSIFDAQYKKLYSAFTGKFGSYPLGIAGKYYLTADGIDRTFDLWFAKSDKRCSAGYRLVLVYSTHRFELMYRKLGINYEQEFKS